MKYSEKLSALLALTATTNAAIARAIKVDSAQISRMKTGSRGMPLKKEIIRAMADYFAPRFDSNYLISALYELTCDIRLHPGAEHSTLSNIIFDWLIRPDSIDQNNAGRFLTKFEAVNTNKKELPPFVHALSNPRGMENNGYLAYYQNIGKRQAVRDFIAFILAREEPSIIRIFSDEDTGFLKDAIFTSELERAMRQLIAKGCCCQQILPPLGGLESSLHSVKYWLSAYMSGSLHQFYYPFARDGLHRRTILVVPDSIFLSSMSLSGQEETQITTLSIDPITCDIYNRYFQDILDRCIPMTKRYTAQEPEEILECLAQFDSIAADSICQSIYLSTISLPLETIQRLKSAKTASCNYLAHVLYSRMQRRAQTFASHKLTEIMCLPPLDEVMEGKVPIPGTSVLSDKALFYTPGEYKSHLQNILHCLESYPNYRVILTDTPPSDGATIYAKGAQRTLLIHEPVPFSLFDVTEQNLSASFYDYLQRNAQQQMRQQTPGGTAAAKLHREISELNKLL
ncbi:MAG: hypothetical protein VB082_06720 [Christensenella sp.]|nr:hypothetical protein [Christensenella sp.]